MDKEPKKVLHVVYAMNTGGVESWLMSIYRQLDREKIQFDFLVNTQEKAFFDDEIRQLGGNIIYAGALNNPLKIYRSAKKILNDSEYVAVHCHNVENATPVLIAARLNGITVRIYQSHNDLNNELSLEDKIKVKIKVNKRNYYLTKKLRDYN